MSHPRLFHRTPHVDILNCDATTPENHPHLSFEEIWKFTIFLIQDEASSVSTGNLHLNRGPRSNLWPYLGLNLWPYQGLNLPYPTRTQPMALPRTQTIHPAMTKTMTQTVPSALPTFWSKFWPQHRVSQVVVSWLAANEDQQNL